MKPKHSKPDSRGVMFVACSECNRGGNGDESCSSGWKIKRGGPEKGACFSGDLLDKFKEDKEDE
ncbi:hypothetical protein D3C74_241550 [compost metagenome]